MNNNITISGNLTIEVNCQCCGITEEVKYEVCENNWLEYYDIDLTIDRSKIIDKLMRRGWKEINYKFICSDCANEEVE